MVEARQESHQSAFFIDRNRFRDEHSPTGCKACRLLVSRNRDFKSFGEELAFTAARKLVDTVGVLSIPEAGSLVVAHMEQDWCSSIVHAISPG